MESKEQIEQRQRMEAQMQANVDAANKIESAKQKTEFNRYKQDCRKKALEFAHYRMNNIGEGVSKGGKELTILSEADNIYNWLISIPNE